MYLVHVYKSWGASESALDLSKAKISVKNQTYTGRPLKPAAVVQLGGRKLVSGVDYTIKYGSNKEVGKATITLAGKGDYKGTARASFAITRAAQKIAVKKVVMNSWTIVLSGGVVSNSGGCECAGAFRPKEEIAMTANWTELMEEHEIVYLRADFWSMPVETRSRMLDMLGASGTEERRWWEELLGVRPGNALETA